MMAHRRGNIVPIVLLLIDGEILKLPARPDIFSGLCKVLFNKYFLWFLLADVQKVVVKTTTKRFKHMLPAPFVHTLAIMIIEGSTGDKASLTELFSDADLLKELKRTRIESTCTTKHDLPFALAFLCKERSQFVPISETRQLEEGMLAFLAVLAYDDSVKTLLSKTNTDK